MEEKQRNLLMILLFVGVLMGALDLAIIGPALPAIQSDFALDNRQLAWLFNIYILFQLVGTPLLAKMSDRFGPRTIYIFSLSMFALGSLVLILAPSAWLLLVGRAIQGFGGAGIFPVAAVVIGEVFPADKRGGALGILGAVFGLAFLIGPILGGFLLQFSWQWLFLINLPIAAALIWGAVRLLPTTIPDKEHLPFDYKGAVLLSIALTGLAVAVTNFDSANAAASFGSLDVWPYLLCFAVLLPIYWTIERHAADPIIRPAFFHSRQIRLSASIAMGVGAMSSSTAFYPLLAVAALGVTESAAAFLLVPGVLATTLMSPVAGILVDKVGSRIVVVTGLVCIFAGFLMYGLLEMTTATFIAAGIIAGIGFATSLGAPLRMIVLNEAEPEHRTSAQGLLNVFLAIGHMLGAAIVGGVAASLGGGALGYQTAYASLAVIVVLMFLMGLALKSKTAEQLAQPAQAT